MTAFSLSAVGIWVAALVLCLFAGPAEARAGLLLGWAAAGLCGFLSFSLLAYSGRRPLKTLPVAILGGFAGRLAVAIVGLVIARHFDFSLFGFCLSFFAIYWLFFGLEYLALRHGQRPASASPAPEGI
jgi:hypothetical protein